MATVAWRHLIPKLFSRLNHRDSFVRDYVKNFFIGIAKVILYSVILGMTDHSKMQRMKSRDENISKRKSLIIYRSNDERSQNEIEDDVEKQENLLAIQNSFRLISNVLSETNAHVVGQVKLFVYQLQHVTVLWDELWLRIVG